MLQYRFAADARVDVKEIRRRSLEKFGEAAASRYLLLIEQAADDVAAEINRNGVRHEPKFGVMKYHISNSKERARDETGIVKNARHILVFRLKEPDLLEIVRVLHDSMDLKRHLP